MPTTEKLTKRRRRPDEDIDTNDLPTRDTETQEKLDETEALLDEIDSVLDTETIEHVLTISDLIRAGAKRAPQAFGTWKNCNGATCAFQAAADEAQARGII